MKKLSLLFVIAMLFTPPFVQAEGAKGLSLKVQRILNALSFAEIGSESELSAQVRTACQNSQCTTTEQNQALSTVVKMSNCRSSELKAVGVQNQDLAYLCRTQQAMLGCDSLRTPLMRKMCYSANGYSLQTLAIKEASILNGNRQPASISKPRK